MPNVRVLRQSFSGGELSPRLFGRLDFASFQSGLETCKNFIALPHGSAMNRPGLRFVNETKTSEYKTRLIPFTFSTTQAFAIEMGRFYFRFHALGGTLNLLPLSSDAYQVVTPYTEDELFDVHFVQSGDVITLTHPNHPPKELRRLGNTNWTLTNIAFSPTSTAPASCTVTATSPGGGPNKDYTYKITALNDRGLEESLASPVSNTVSNNLTLTGNYNTVTWPAVTGATMYNVYKSASGAYGFIGQTAALTLVDDNIMADMTRTLPILDNPFNSADHYPTAVGYYEQRRYFAGTETDPMNVWATQSGSETNLAYSVPSQDSDALRFRIMANRSDIVRHLINLQDLIVLTAANEWRVASSGNGPLTPSTINIKSQSQVGASNVQPKVIDNYLLYEAAQGGHIREFTYDWQSNGFRSGDISLLASHLFDGYTIKDMAYSRAPWQILWCVSTSGKLLGLSYVPEQKIAAWHQHETDGQFESCCTINENGADVLYVIVKRTIDGVQKRYVEYLDLRDAATLADSFFVDCGLTYSGTATTTISGLDHLEGKTVSVLGDGAVLSQKTVVAGEITLEVAVSKAQVGLPITADLKTLPTYFQDETLGQSRIKNVNKVWVRIAESGPFSAGPDESHLTPIKLRTFETYGSPIELKTGEFDLVVQSNWNQSGQVLIRQDDPLPLEVVYVAAEVAIGG
jgi:hypothetical protein